MTDLHQSSPLVTRPEILTRLRISRETLESSGILERCWCIPAGTLGRYDLWRWCEVEAAAFELFGRPPGNAIPRRAETPKNVLMVANIGDFEKIA